MAREIDRSEIDAILGEECVVRIGCAAAGEIFVVPVAYVYDGESLLAFSYPGRKLEMMTAEPRVCFEIDRIAHLGNWSSVIGWGIFEVLEGESRERGKRMLAERLSGRLVDEVSRERLRRAMSDDPGPVVFRIIIESVSGRSEG